MPINVNCRSAVWTISVRQFGSFPFSSLDIQKPPRTHYFPHHSGPAALTAADLQPRIHNRLHNRLAK